MNFVIWFFCVRIKHKYNNPDCISLGSENSDPYNDVSNYGWFDYKVWYDSPFNDVKLSGYFDCRWN